jgi:hypothetical protein
MPLDPTPSWFIRPVRPAALLAAALIFVGCDPTEPVRTQPQQVPDPTRFVSAAYLDSIDRYLDASAVPEISGQVSDSTGFWALQDSGNPNQLVRLDPATGKVLQRVTIRNAENRDWEELASDADHFYIGNFGNNRGARQDLEVLKVPRAGLSLTAETQQVDAESIRFRYAAQTTYEASSDHNVDCEAMILLDGSLVLFSKNRGDLKTYAYRLPTEPGDHVLTPFEVYDADGLITGAAWWPGDQTGGRPDRLLLTGYDRDVEGAFMLVTQPGADRLFPDGGVTRHPIGKAGVTWQVEAVSVTPEGDVLISNENEEDHVPASVWHVRF